MCFSHNSRVHTTHIRDTLEVPVSGEQGTLHQFLVNKGQDLFMGPLLSRARDLSFLRKKHGNRHRKFHKMRQRSMSQMKEQDKLIEES